MAWVDSPNDKEEVLKWEKEDRNRENTPRNGPFKHPHFSFCNYVLNWDPRKLTNSRIQISCATYQWGNLSPSICFFIPGRLPRGTNVLNVFNADSSESA